ncbi:hypothetical protein STANM337S_07152 [Streptomyces tanashiensis]
MEIEDCVLHDLGERGWIPYADRAGVTASNRGVAARTRGWVSVEACAPIRRAPRMHPLPGSARRAGGTFSPAEWRTYLLGIPLRKVC